jgi:hypothetical protein
MCECSSTKMTNSHGMWSFPQLSTKDAGQQASETPRLGQAAQRDARRRHPSASDGYPARCEAYLVRTPQRRASAATPQMGLFRRPASPVCPKYTRISRAPGALQDAEPAGRPGSVAVSRPWRDGGAEERPGRAGTRHAGAEQGRPVLDEAQGVAERSRGEGRQTYDTHD